MKKASLKTNYIYNAIYQIFAMIVILITTPYVTRVLGAEQIGIYSYTYSIVTYFILFSTLGITLYAQREIAYCQNDKEKRSRIFFEIVILKIILLLLAIVVFYFLFCINGEYSIYYKILILELVANGIDIIWLFQGMEDFKKVVIRNMIVKVLIVALIFILVKDINDLWKYTLLYSLSSFIGNISLWFSVPKYITKVDIKSISFIKHLKPVLVLFIPQIAIQVYISLDKTMLGLITNDMTIVGIYEKSQELAKLGLSVVTAFGTVVFPRMASSFIAGKKDELKNCLRESFAFIWIIALPVMFGLMSISSKFVPWFLGPDFSEVANLLVVFSIIIIVIGLNNVIGMQYLVATKQQKYFSITVAIGAAVNVIFNSLLIGKYGYYGAVIATILAETSVLVAQFIKIWEDIKDCLEIKTMFKCLISSITMALIISFIGRNMQPIIQTSVIQIMCGVILYFTMLVIMKEKVVIDVLYKIFQKLRRKQNGTN